MWPPHKVPSITSEVLIFENQELFELSPEDLHQLYMKMHEDVPEAMDYQLRRRAILNGDEWVIRGKQTYSKYRVTRIAHTDTQTDIQKRQWTANWEVELIPQRRWVRNPTMCQRKTDTRQLVQTLVRQTQRLFTDIQDSLNRQAKTGYTEKQKLLNGQKLFVWKDKNAFTCRDKNRL